MTHNEDIKTFDDLSRHMELEVECLEAAKPNGLSYTAQSGSRRSFGSKRKKNQDRKKGNSEPAPEKADSTKCKRDMRGGKKGKTSTTCFNCDKEDTLLVIAQS